MYDINIMNNGKMALTPEWIKEKIKQGKTSRDCARSSGYSKSHILKFAKKNGVKFNNKNPYKK